MGAGASTVARLRKTLILRSYNLRSRNETVDEQFRRFSFRGDDRQLYISISSILMCLEMSSADYDWVELSLHRLLGDEVSAVKYFDFIRFLESGKPPSLSPGKNIEPDQANSPTLPPRSVKRGKGKESTPTFSPHTSVDPLRMSRDDREGPRVEMPGSFPPIPPLKSTWSGKHVLDASEVQIDPAPARIHEESLDEPGQTADNQSNESVVRINLSDLSRNNLPSHAPPTGNEERADDCDDEIIVSSEKAPSSSLILVNKETGLESHASPKPLWRKREIVKQERTIHYTTVDADGVQQELVEKETTQSEVLHMECRETGEFAHRETTRFEQLETFNEEVVNEVNGTEEYVHLKSIDDEFHYMESTMPPKPEEQNDTPHAADEAAGGEGCQENPSFCPSDLPDGMTPEEFEEAYRRHVEEVQHNQMESDGASNVNEQQTPNTMNKVHNDSAEEDVLYGDVVNGEERFDIDVTAQENPCSLFATEAVISENPPERSNSYESLHDID